MTIADIKHTAEQKMARSIEAFKAELQKIRTGRAHPGILDHVHVDYYGTMMPINQVANVTLADARTLPRSTFNESTVLFIFCSALFFISGIIADAFRRA